MSVVGGVLLGIFWWATIAFDVVCVIVCVCVCVGGWVCVGVCVYVCVCVWVGGCGLLWGFIS